MRWLDGVLILFGIVNILGGIGGYATAGSTMSLFAGGGAGVVVIAGAALARSHPTPGYALAGLATLAVGALMANRYVETQKVMPALMLAVMSAAVLVCLVVGHFAARKPH